MTETTQERYARIVDDAVVETRWFNIWIEPDAEGNPVEFGRPAPYKPEKGLDWRPFPEVEAPDYNKATHHAPVRSVEVQPKQVVERWADPVAKTTGEMETEKDDAKEQQLDDATADKVTFLALFNHENRIRALEGSKPITEVQMRAALKELL